MIIASFFHPTQGVKTATQKDKDGMRYYLSYMKAFHNITNINVVDENGEKVNLYVPKCKGK